MNKNKILANLILEFESKNKCLPSKEELKKLKKTANSIWDKDRYGKKQKTKSKRGKHGN